MKSRIAKRSITIAGHKTAELVAAINLDRQRGNLSSAIRLIVLDFYRNQLSEQKRHGTHLVRAG